MASYGGLKKASNCLRSDIHDYQASQAQFLRKMASPTARSDLQLTGIGWRKLEKEMPFTNDLCLRS